MRAGQDQERGCSLTERWVQELVGQRPDPVRFGRDLDVGDRGYSKGGSFMLGKERGLEAFTPDTQAVLDGCFKPVAELLANRFEFRRLCSKPEGVVRDDLSLPAVGAKALT